MSESSTAAASRTAGARYRLWRAWTLLVAMPLSYPLFVLGSLIMLSMIPIAVVRFRAREDRTRWLRQRLHLGARLWVWVTTALQILDVTIDARRSPQSLGTAPGLPRASADGTGPTAPVLVIANHPSLIDVLLITAALPNLCCVLKGALHYNPLFTLLIRHLDYLPNSDPERMLAEGSARLQAGEQLLIFPEGTRSEPGETLKFRFGAAELALRSGAAALPVTIHSSTRYLSKGYPWYRLPAERLRYRLELGPLLSNSHCTPLESRQRRRPARRALNERWLEHFRQRLAALGVGN